MGNLLRKSLFAGAVFALLSVNVTAQAPTSTTVGLTGFTADVIAEGATFTPGTTTTADVDGGGYCFLIQSFTAFGTPDAYLPNSGFISSATTPGLNFQLASATANNSLRLATQGASGVLRFSTPHSAGILYVLATSGSGTSTVDMVVKFTDSTSQSFPGQSISDWYGGSNFAIQGIGRANTNGQSLDDGTDDPRLYQLALPLNDSNYTKSIAYFTVTKLDPDGSGFAQIMAASVVPPPSPCTTPTSQPTGLNLPGFTIFDIFGNFSSAAGNPSGYLVVRYPNGATPTPPVNGVVYAVDSALGVGTIVSAGPDTTFDSHNLNSSTIYTYYVYAYNNTYCTGGPLYDTIAPISASQTTASCGTMIGIIPIGPTAPASPAGFATITDALTNLSIHGMAGSIVLSLQSDYTSTGETFPITFPISPCSNPTTTLTIRPAAGANGLSITNNDATPTIDFAGVKYVVIDGRPGGVGSTIAVTPSGSLNPVNLNIINTNIGGSAILIDQGANYNKVMYCDLQGKNNTDAVQPSTMAGVVYIGNTWGNDYNTIDHCNIHATGTGTNLPSMGVFSLGVTNNGWDDSFNNGDTISNCNIYDFFLASGNSAGIELTQGVDSWSILNNNLFQTAPRTYSAAGFNRGIWVDPNTVSGSSVGNGFTITGNNIGGSAPGATGTPYTVTAQDNMFEGIRLEVADDDNTKPSLVDSNTITNIAQTTTITTTGNPFRGISLSNCNGRVRAGASAGNIIGSGTTTGAITINAGTGSQSMGLAISGTGNIFFPLYNCFRNVIGGITLSGAGNSFSGMYFDTYGQLNAINNFIGGSVANSIYVSSTSTAASFIKGVNIPSGSGSSLVTGNSISNLSNASLATGTTSCQVEGIAIAGVTASGDMQINAIENNVIRNLYNASSVTGAGAAASTIGISMNSIHLLSANVDYNIIDSLVTAGNDAVSVTGLYYNGGSLVPHTIAKNFIHSLDASAGNTGAILSGIWLSGGNANVSNNMIRLGIKANGNAITSPLSIYGIQAATNITSTFYYNSIYIGGSGVGNATNNTYAFNSSASPNLYDMRNNIFSNVRSNTSTGGAHYAIALNGTSVATTSDHNVYQYSGTGGLFASVTGGNTSIATYNPAAAWITGDVNSVSGDPRFINPTGTAATVNLHINPAIASVASNAGTPIASVTDDFDGDARSATTPDIGADEFTTALPVTLVNFWGQKQAADNILYWTTATEINNKGFELQRSIDGNTFTTLSFIPSKATNGNSSSLLNYEAVDLQPSTGNNYYRLKQVDKDGNASYSNIVLLKGDETTIATVVAVYPNPVTDHLDVMITTKENANVSLMITDMNGKTITIQNAQLAPGTNRMRVNTSLLVRGTYAVKIQTADGNAIHTSLFMK